MRALGFSDAALTSNGADGGIDIRASAAVAQVKFLSAPVGSPDIQRLRGAAHGVELALFYSASSYTAAATATASNTGVALFSFDIEGRVVPVNALALQHTSAAAAISPIGLVAGYDPHRRNEVLGRLGELQIRVTAYGVALDKLIDRLRDPDGIAPSNAVAAFSSHLSLKQLVCADGSWVKDWTLILLDEGKPLEAGRRVDEGQRYFDEWIERVGVILTPDLLVELHQEANGPSSTSIAEVRLPDFASWSHGDFTRSQVLAPVRRPSHRRRRLPPRRR